MATGLEPLIIGALIGGGGAAAAGAGVATIAGVAALGAIGGGSLFASGQQSKLDLATLEANKEQAKLDSAQAALSNSRSFRQSMASQLALANFRGGPGSSIARQFGSDSISTFFEDQKAIERGMKGIDTASTLARADIKLGRTARDFGTASSIGGSIFGAMNASGGGAPTGGK